MRNDKRHWAQSIQPGDIICDCRYQHLTVAEVEQEYLLNWRVEILLERLPLKWSKKIRNFLIQRGWLCRYYDSTLILEDGAHCSAINCCDPVDNHPPHEE